MMLAEGAVQGTHNRGSTPPALAASQRHAPLPREAPGAGHRWEVAGVGRPAAQRGRMVGTLAVGGAACELGGDRGGCRRLGAVAAAHSNQEAAAAVHSHTSRARKEAVAGALGHCQEPVAPSLA